MDLDWKKGIVLTLLILILIAVVIVNYSKNCGTDSQCFNSRAKVCSKAYVTLPIEQNEEYFEVLGPKSGSCVVLVKMSSVSTDINPDLRRFLDGKGMICDVPSIQLQNNNIESITSLSDYCTGPLKEALLQATVEKLYEVVVKNIGSKAIEDSQLAVTQ